MLSPNSARQAEQLGYTAIKVYHDGLPAWKKSGNPVYSTAKALADFNDKKIPFVIVDVRPAIAGGVIPGAVSIPEGSLASRQSDFPKQKDAPVILYGDGEKAALEAFSVVRGWGYKNASILQGGLGSWTAAGGELSPEAAGKIVYVPVPRPGEVSAAEFRRIVEEAPGGTIILDVRGRDETAAGMVKGAVNIPLTELADRVGELGKDRDIIAQCNTGVMAELAWSLLTDLGYHARWLNARITFGPGGAPAFETD